MAARLVLANVANNVNRLAHQAHSFALSGETPVDAADVQRALAEVRAVITRVDAVAAGSGDGDAG